MTDKNAEESDRRDFFRFDDTLTLKVRLPSAQQIESITQDFDAFRLRYCLKSHIQNLNDIRKPRLMRIRGRDMETAAYLEGIEQQIVKIAERLDQLSNVSQDSIEVRGLMNVSATGIRFDSTIPLQVDQVIEISMILSTQNIQVIVLGEVQRLVEKDAGIHEVTVEYTHIHSEDVETIVRHLARLQQLQLQAARNDEM